MRRRNIGIILALFLVAGCASTPMTLNLNTLNKMEQIKGVESISVWYDSAKHGWSVRAYLNTPCGETMVVKKGKSLEESIDGLIKENECLQKCSEEIENEKV